MNRPPRGGAAASRGLVRTVVLEHSPVRRAVFLGLLPSDEFQLRFPTDEHAWAGAFEGYHAQIVMVWQEDPGRFAETCARVRAIPEATELPLVLVSRRRVGVDRTTGTEAGADGIVLLPAGAPEAREEIEAALEARGRGKGRPKTAPLPPRGAAAPVRAALTPPPEPPPAAAPPAPQATSDEFAAQVTKLHATVESATHYEILGVAREASSPEVTLAFHGGAVAYHPDRFVHLEDPELRRMIYEIYKRMSKAYAVLADPRQRAAYDQSLQGATPRAEWTARATAGATAGAAANARARSPQGRKFLDMAERSMQQGKYRAARLQLAIAMQVEPGNEVLQQMIRSVDQRILENPDSE
jgi:DNA-binding response OmpR family regulator